VRLWESVRLWWREIVRAIALVLPFLVLLPLGFLWLWEQGAVLWWFLGAACLGLVVTLLFLPRRRTAPTPAPLPASDRPLPAGWGEREREAWAKVLAIADATPPLAYSEVHRGVPVVQKVVTVVAEHYHPGDRLAVYRVTLPELLLCTERLSNGLRREVVARIPRVRQITVAGVMEPLAFAQRHGKAAGLVWNVATTTWRFIRLGINPVNAIAAEAKHYLLDSLLAGLDERGRGVLTRGLIEETGRVAIDLYAGRFKVSLDEEAEALAAERAGARAEGVRQITVVVAGQTNAGKSSLINALKGEIVAATGPVAVTREPDRILVEYEGSLTLVVVDLPGLGGEGGFEALRRKAADADLIVWCADATQPARAVDVEALKALREAFANAAKPSPPVVIALTHIDQLRPAGEWAPPYDLRSDRPKAVSIRGAAEYVAGLFTLPQSDVVPVSVRSVDASYNLDALWAVLAAKLDQAKNVQLGRIASTHAALSWRTVVADAAAAGRLMVSTGKRVVVGSDGEAAPSTLTSPEKAGR
jgi:predicted GTPase